MRARWISPAAWIVTLAALFVRAPEVGVPSTFNGSTTQLSAPSADEEAGVPSARRLDAVPRRADAVPRRANPRPAGRLHEKQPALRPQERSPAQRSVRHSLKSPAPKPEGPAASASRDPLVVTPPNPSLGGTGTRTEQAAGEEAPPGHGLAPAVGPAAVPPRVPAVPAVPILRPPVLLTPFGLYPDGEYAIAVDRTLVTPELRMLASEGRVVLRLFVRSDGSVGSVMITQSSGHPNLDSAAMRAAPTWRFRPATRDGIAIDAWAVVPVRFVLP